MAKPSASKGGTVEERTPQGNVGGGVGNRGKGGGIGAIHVPEDMGGGDLRLLPDGLVGASLQQVILGVSKTSNQPKATLKYVITENMEGVGADEPSTIGEVVLESLSLQPHAIWKLNDTYKMVSGENLPHGDFSPEQFASMLNETLVGTEWTLVLEQQIPPGQSKPRTTITKKSLR